MEDSLYRKAENFVFFLDILKENIWDSGLYMEYLNL